ncbi:MAG: hypothetical protein AAFX76_00525 [Planctomycetota bacterium]
MHIRSSHLLALCCCGMFTACVPLQNFNPQPSDYLQTIPLDDGSGHAYDLAVIEFDDYGGLWDIQQLEDTLDLIRQRNEESRNGVLVNVYIHGWTHDAEPDRPKGNLAQFRETLRRIKQQTLAEGPGSPDRVVGVYVGWRGATTRLPLLRELSFYDRRQAAERMTTHDMRETLIRITATTKEKKGSKCLQVGHSMGGLILGETMSDTVAVLAILAEGSDIPADADLVLLVNPARDGLAAKQFIDFLKRTRITTELRDPQGRVLPDRGPLIVSITSEADAATGTVYPLGRGAATLNAAFRKDHAEGEPSQRHLVTHTEGHIPFLVSHTARLDDAGRVVLEEVPGRYNDTPFWIVSTTQDIMKDHGDLENPNFGELVSQIVNLNAIYNAEATKWIVRDDSGD